MQLHRGLFLWCKFMAFLSRSKYLGLGLLKPGKFLSKLLDLLTEDSHVLQTEDGHNLLQEA
jgi:hypothetical protein